MKSSISLLLALFFMIAMSTLSFASGQKQATEKPAAAEPVELEFPSWQATEPGTSDFWKALNAAFQKQHPEVTITFTHLPYPAYTKTMITRFAAADTPDIFHLPAANLYAFAQEGWLEPLDPYFEGTDILESWIPLQESWNRYKGDTLALMVLGYGWILGYNQRMLDNEGLSVPATGAEMTEAAAKMTKDTNGDGVTDQFGWAVVTATHSSVVSHFFQQCIGRTGKNVLAEDGSFNEDVVRLGLLSFKKLVDNKSTPMGLNSNGRRSAFSEGRAAMMLEGPWIEGFINKAPDDVRPHLKVGSFPFTHIAGGPSNVLAIPSNLDKGKKDLVAEFVKLFATIEFQRKYAEIAGQPPSRKGVITADILKKRPNMGIYSDAASKAIRYVPPGLELNYTEWRTTMIDLILEYVLHNRPIDKVIADIRDLSLKLKK